VILLCGVTIVLKQFGETENNAHSVKEMADEPDTEIRAADDNIGLPEGRRVHYFDYFKLLDRKGSKLADYEPDDQDSLYLYKSYHLAVEKVRELAPGCSIKVYNLDFIGHFKDAYALQFEVGGEEYLFPFDDGDDLDMDFYNLDDYHKLPKTEDFLAAVDEIFAELEEQKKLQKPGEKYYGYPVVQLKIKE